MSEAAVILLFAGIVSLSWFAVSRLSRTATEERIRRSYRRHPMLTHQWLIGETHYLPEDWK